MKLRILDKIRSFLIIVLPAILYFSYFPVLKLGETDSMHLELSLPLIWLGIFSLLSIVIWIKESRSLFGICFSKKRDLKNGLLTLLFPIFITLSVIWSENCLRGLLTAAIIWCLYISIFSFLEVLSNKNGAKKSGMTEEIKNQSISKKSKRPKTLNSQETSDKLEKSSKLAPKIFENFKSSTYSYAKYFQKISPKFYKVLKISTVFACLFCILQCILDTIGVSRDKTLLCLGCTSTYFGFPHPNGFAIEPQFMGNLLLIPVILACNSLLENKTAKSQVIYTLLVLTTLFLTFSRGAIYAFLAALIILIIAHYFDWRRNLKLLALICCSFALSLGLQITFATKNVNYYTSPKETISKVLDQLTLGRLNIADNSSRSGPGNDFASNVDPASDSSPVFSGYVAESTNRRLELSKYALDIWNDSPGNILFGTGLGSAGTKMLEKFPSQGTSKEIVQNQYLETLLETGTVGSALLLLSIFEILKRSQKPRKSYQIAILVAFAISLCFFSGLPNALHVYLLPILL